MTRLGYARALAVDLTPPMTLRRRFLFAACTSVLVLAACGGQGLLDGSEVRLVNATSDFTSLDLYESSNKLKSGVGALAASDYEEVEADSYTFNVVSSGATTASVGGSLEKDEKYTVLATASGGTVTATLIAETEDEPDSGAAKLRFFNTANANVGAVDAYLVTSECSNLASTSAAAVATSVSGLQTSWSQVTASSSGSSYHLCITAAGDRSDLRLDVPAYTLKSKQVVTFVVTDTTGGVLLNGGSLVQKGDFTAYRNTQARVRLAAGMPAGSAVTGRAAGSTLASSLATGVIGSYRTLTAGEIELGADVTSGGGTTSVGSTAVLTAGSDYTMLVAGPAGAPAITVVADDNRLSTSSSRPVKVRLLNGMNGSGTASLLVDATGIGSGAAPGASSGYGTVEASSALARIEVVGAPGQICLSTGATLTANRVYTVFLAGDLPATPGPCTLRGDR